MSDYAKEATRHIAAQCEKWTKRCDDAKRIPDMLYDFGPAIIQAAIDASTTELIADRDAYAFEILYGIAGIVPTPEKGYIKDGGPAQVKADLRLVRLTIQRLTDLVEVAREGREQAENKAKEAVQSEMGKLRASTTEKDREIERLKAELANRPSAHAEWCDLLQNPECGYACNCDRELLLAENESLASDVGELQQHLANCRKALEEARRAKAMIGNTLWNLRHHPESWDRPGKEWIPTFESLERAIEPCAATLAALPPEVA